MFDDLAELGGGLLGGTVGADLGSTVATEVFDAEEGDLADTVATIGGAIVGASIGSDLIGGLFGDDE